MRILMCHNSYRKTSGEDIVIAEDKRILREGGCEVLEYTRSNLEIDHFSIWEKTAFFPNTVHSIRTTREISALVDQVKPDTAIVQNVFPLISPSLYHALHRKRIPIVQLVYNYRLICPNAILFTQGAICERCIRGNFAHAVIHRCYQGSLLLSALYATSIGLHRHMGDLANVISAYVTPDQFLKQKLVEGGIASDRIFALSNPFDIKKYEPFFGHGGYFVYFGRIVREKGIFTLLEAASKTQEYQYVVVGGGEAEAEARRFVERARLGNVQFCGSRYGSDLQEILQGARAVIVPTQWYDNSPLVVHQSFALGKPVIASDIDGIPEVVVHGKNGLLFPPGDANQLVDRLRLLAENDSLCLTLAKNARRKAESEFTVEHRYRGLMDVLQIAIHNNGSQ